MLPDIGHLKEVGIYPGLLAGAAKGRLMHRRRTRGNNYPVKPQLLNILLNEFLTRVGTHELIVTSDDYCIQVLGKLGYLTAINSSGDVTTTMADIYPNSRFHSSPYFSF